MRRIVVSILTNKDELITRAKADDYLTKSQALNSINDLMRMFYYGMFNYANMKLKIDVVKDGKTTKTWSMEAYDPKLLNEVKKGLEIEYKDVQEKEKKSPNGVKPKQARWELEKKVNSTYAKKFTKKVNEITKGMNEVIDEIWKEEAK